MCQYNDALVKLMVIAAMAGIDILSLLRYSFIVLRAEYEKGKSFRDYP